MHNQSAAMMWVTLRVARFTPKPQRDTAGKAAGRSSSPFARRTATSSSSPFARRRSTSSPFARFDANHAADSHTHDVQASTVRASDSRSSSVFAAQSYAHDNDEGGVSVPHSTRVRGKRWTQEYRMRLHSEDTVLQALLTIKQTIDPTLAFRYSCGHGMCGSDAVAINGTPTLLCTAKIGEWAKPMRAVDTADGFRKTGVDEQQSDHSGVNADVQQSAQSDHRVEQQAMQQEWVIDLASLPGFAVQRDLIADIDPMLEQIKRLKPYLQAQGTLALTDEGKVNVFEYLQKPEELAQYELLSNCIACGVCEGSCPVYAGGEAFVGPAAVVVASRFMHDSRDTATEARLAQIGQPDAAPACQSVRACSMHCPKGIDVGEEIWNVIQQVDQAQ